MSEQTKKVNLELEIDTNTVDSSKNKYQGLIDVNADGTKEAIMAVHTLSNGKIVKTERGATRID